MSTAPFASHSISSMANSSIFTSSMSTSTLSPRRARTAFSVAIAFAIALGMTAFVAVDSTAWAQDDKSSAKPPTEDDFYPIVPLPLPEGVVLEVGAQIGRAHV